MPIVVARDKTYDLLYAICIQFVEDVVQQQQWSFQLAIAPAGINDIAQKVKLCQFECSNKCFVLSLTALTFHHVVIQHKVKIVAMNAVKRIAHDAVFRPVAAYHVKQGTALAVRFILYCNSLARCRYLFIYMLEYGSQLFYKLFTLAVYGFSEPAHFLLHQLHESQVGLFFCLQHGVSLSQSFIVAGQSVYIGVVVL